MGKKYYAVAKGKTPGIYFTWEDCRIQVEGVPGAVYKGFQTISEAAQFMEAATGEKQNTLWEEDTAVGTDGLPDEEVSTEHHLVAYVDGSYEHSRLMYAYGCVLVFPDEVITLNGSGADEDYVAMRNVAGEILGSEQAVKWAVAHGYASITIYYDYEGIEKWANGIWKTNKLGTQRYQAFIAEQRKQIQISFQKVAAHTGNRYNEMADRLAKEALGIEDKK